MKKTTIDLCRIVTMRTKHARTCREHFNTKAQMGASVVEMLACASDCMCGYEALIEAMAELVDRLSGRGEEGGAE